MGKTKSLSKAVHFMSDVTTVFLNPISDKTLKGNHPPQHPYEDCDESKVRQVNSNIEEGSGDFVDEPDTSSFAAFIYSLLSSSEATTNAQNEGVRAAIETPSETTSKKGVLARGKQSLKFMYNAARNGGFRNQERRDDSTGALDGLEMNHIRVNDADSDSFSVMQLNASDPSMLLSEKSKSMIYTSLPVLVQGRNWLLLYSSWKHGISLSTLYRKSTLWPGLSLLVVGDRKGAVFGGLVEAPLKPSQNKKYQGTNSTFVFTTIAGSPMVYHPTGANRYFTLCSPDYLAIGGGGHFALYLESDLLSGSSSVSETYGNPCLASSENFEVKAVELWAFVHGSKYDEILALSRTEAPGICRW